MAKRTKTVQPLNKNTIKINGNTKTYYKNRAIIKDLLQQGLKNNDIAQITGLRQETVSRMKKDIIHSDLGNRKTVKLAHNAVNSLLKSDNEKIKLDTSKMVYDRVHPVVNQVEMKTMSQRIPYDPSGYLNEEPEINEDGRSAEE
jgi:hypothetical protein